MINFKSEAEMEKVLANYDLPELDFVGRKDAGPDEELYFYETADGVNYGVWSRDYMSELEFEAAGLKTNFDIEVAEWIRSKDGEEVVCYDGDYFAVFIKK